MEVIPKIVDGCRRFANARLRDEHEREDLVQEAVLAVIEKMDQVRAAEDPVLYAGRIAANRMLSLLRQRNRPDRKAVDVETVEDAVLRRSVDDAVEFIELVRNGVRRLSRRAMRLFAERLHPSDGVADLMIDGQEVPKDHQIAEGLGWSRATACRASAEVAYEMRRAIYGDEP